MRGNFDKCLPKFLRHEGGYVDHPRDPGGATNKGVTLANFRRYVKRGGTKADLRKLTDKQAGIVFKKFYWDKVRGDDLPAGVDYAVADFGINSGPSRAIKFLQRVVGVKPDGKIGPITLTAVDAMDPSLIVRRLCDARLAWLKRLRHWDAFGRGWERRVRDVKQDGLKMVGSKPSRPKPVPKEAQPKISKPAPKSLWEIISEIVEKVFG